MNTTSDEILKRAVHTEFKRLKKAGKLRVTGPTSPVNRQLRKLFETDTELKDPATSAVKCVFTDSIYQTRTSARWHRENRPELFTFYEEMWKSNRKVLRPMIAGARISNVRDETNIANSVKSVAKLATWLHGHIEKQDGTKFKNSPQGPISFWTKFLAFHTGQVFIYDRYTRIGVTSIINPKNKGPCALKPFVVGAAEVCSWCYKDPQLTFQKLKYIDAYLMHRGRK